MHVLPQLGQQLRAGRRQGRGLAGEHIGQRQCCLRGGAAGAEGLFSEWCGVGLVWVWGGCGWVGRVETGDRPNRPQQLKYGHGYGHVTRHVACLLACLLVCFVCLYLLLEGVDGPEGLALPRGAQQHQVQAAQAHAEDGAWDGCWVGVCWSVCVCVCEGNDQRGAVALR